MISYDAGKKKKKKEEEEAMSYMCLMFTAQVSTCDVVETH